LQLDPAEFLKCRVVLLAHLFELLVRFIGPTLALRKIGEIWPNIRSTIRTSAKEAEDGKEK
jgi:hypothetical protein